MHASLHNIYDRDRVDSYLTHSVFYKALRHFYRYVHDKRRVRIADRRRLQLGHG